MHAVEVVDEPRQEHDADARATSPRACSSPDPTTSWPSCTSSGYARWVADYYPVDAVEELGDGRLAAHPAGRRPALAGPAGPAAGAGGRPSSSRPSCARRSPARAGATLALYDADEPVGDARRCSGRRRSMTDMTHALVIPLIAGLGPPELLIIVGVLVLLFGAKKLPELARGSGRALRIFKAETKGLIDDDDDDRPRPPSSARSTRATAPRPRPSASRARARRPRHARHRPDDGPAQLCPSAASSSCSAAGPVTPSARAGGCRSATTSASCAPASCASRSTSSSARSSRCSSTTSSSSLILDPYNQAREMLGQRTPDPGRDHRRRHPAAAPAQALRHRRASSPPRRSGSTRSGASSSPACTATSAGGPGSSRSPPGRCSSPVSRWATTCCPRASPP